MLQNSCLADERSFYLSYSNDIVFIYDGTPEDIKEELWDSKSTPQFPKTFYSTNLSMTINFTSDHEVTSKGFRIGINFEYEGLLKKFTHEILIKQ